MKYRWSWSDILIRLIAWTVIGTCTYLLLAEPSQADDYANMSIGMFSNGIPSPANVKMGELGHRDPIGLGFINDYNGGAWIQTSIGDGRKSSGFVSDQLGVEVNNGIVIRGEAGPCLISSPDSYLGGVFQFHETLFIGIHDPHTDNEIGFTYQHFSSAGVEMPNKGKDFGGIEISFPF